MTTAILVDTHFILWVRVAPQRLSDGERRALEAARPRYVSIVSLWEIAILIALGRIGDDLRLLDVPDGFDLLPVTPGHCAALVTLPSCIAIRSTGCCSRKPAPSSWFYSRATRRSSITVRTGFGCCRSELDLPNLTRSRSGG